MLKGGPQIAEAQYSLGLELLAKNAQLARESFEAAAAAAAAAGNKSTVAAAHYQLALLGLAQQRPDVPEAKAHLLAAAELGHAEATYRLSVLLRGEVKDPQSLEKTSVELLEDAAELDHSHCMFLLGIAHVKGEGTCKDPERAVYWWRKAAHTGHAQAQYNLGAAYANGFGVEKNAAAAHHWWRLAALNGHDYAAADLEAQMMGEATVRVVASNQRKFEKWMERLKGYTKHVIASLVFHSAVLTDDAISSLAHARTPERLVELLCHMCTDEQMDAIFLQEVRERYQSEGVHPLVVADDSRGKLRRAGRSTSMPGIKYTSPATGTGTGKGSVGGAEQVSPALRRSRVGSVTHSLGGVRLGDVFLKHMTPLEKRMWRDAELAALHDA